MITNSVDYTFDYFKKTEPVEQTKQAHGGYNPYVNNSGTVMGKFINNGSNCW